MTWHDLSDSELRARLAQRGVDPAWARQLAHYRDRPTFAELIDEALAR